MLDDRLELHRLHDHLVRVVTEEVGELDGRLGWPQFTAVFWRIVRRVSLGEAARDDERVTDLMVALRAQANWAFARPRSRRRLRELATRLRDYMDDADPQSLAGIVATTPAPPGTAALGQVPHWLFAFDAAGIATFRALALLTAHPEVLAVVRSEDPAAHRGLRPLARASVLESVRLWPTTLVILRDSLEETEWAGRTAPAGTGFAVASSFFHRDDTRLPWADAFQPDVWLDGRAEASRALVPFSAGPARCPGRTLVLDLTGELLSAIVARFDLSPAGRGRPLRPRDLPRTLAHTLLVFDAARR